jgi:hypothetical protein
LIKSENVCLSLVGGSICKDVATGPGAACDSTEMVKSMPEWERYPQTKNAALSDCVEELFSMPMVWKNFLQAVTLEWFGRTLADAPTYSTLLTNWESDFTG